MDSERLVPFIIIMVIWGASNVLRKIARAGTEKQAPAEHEPDLWQSLQQSLAALEETSIGGQLPDLEGYSQPAPQSQIDEPERASLIEMAEVSLAQEPATSGRGKVSVSPPAGGSKPRPTICPKKSVAMTNRRKLQHAVIWAEILAPPVALRDQ